MVSHISNHHLTKSFLITIILHPSIFYYNIMKNFKKFNYLLITAIVICLTSCSDNKGTNNSSSDNPVTLRIEENGMGDFSKYGSFLGEVVIKPSNDSEVNSEGEKTYVVSIPLKITSPVAWQYNLDFELTVADESHITIAELDDLYVDGETDFDNGDYDSYLMTGSHRQLHEFNLSDEIWEKIKNEGKYLVIRCDADSKDRVPYTKSTSNSPDVNESSSPLDDNDEDPSISSNVKDDESTNTSSSDSSDWDSMLDSYEQYVDKYIAYIKKAVKGDMNALEEYPALMEKAKEFSDKMKNAQGEMTPTQWSRYMKIANKMSKAAAEMH